MNSSHLHHPFRVERVRIENAQSRTLFFREALPAQPGQFVMAWLPGVDEKPYSVAAAEPLALVVTAVGPFSEALHRLDVGDRVWVRGPLGQGFRVAPGRLLLVGGGYGVAPLVFLAREAIARGCAVEACIGARTAEEVLLVRDFQAAGAGVRVTTEDGSRDTRGLVTRAAEAAVAEARPDMVYACGPAPMLEAVDRLCVARGLSRQLSWEAHMRCGMGLCGSCELPIPGREDAGWLACMNGPVSTSG